MQTDRSRDWLRQAEDDLSYARYSLHGAFYPQTCFIAQQASEKALKALLLHRGAKVVLTHSLLKLCQALQLNGQLEAAAKLLDQYYITGRYPDALAEGAPKDVFLEEQAQVAVDRATLFIERARQELGHE